MDEQKIIRKCTACSKELSRDKFIKITVNNQKEVEIMPDSKFFGRSAYICKDIDCIEKAFKKGRIFKILKIKQDETLKEKIRAVLEN